MGAHRFFYKKVVVDGAALHAGTHVGLDQVVAANQTFDIGLHRMRKHCNNTRTRNSVRWNFRIAYFSNDGLDRMSSISVSGERSRFSMAW